MSSGGWPAAPGDPVVVLVDATTAVEREVLDAWVRDQRKTQATSQDVDTIELPDPDSFDDATALLDLEARLATGDDPWLAPLRVVWLPVEHDGERTVRLRDVVLSLDNPRHPRASRQRRIVSRGSDGWRVAIGEPARVSDLRKRWAAASGGDEGPGAFTRFVARQAMVTLERAESRLVGAQYKVPRLVREDLESTAHFRSGVSHLARELGRDEAEVMAEAVSYLEEMVTGWTRLLIDLSVRFGRYSFRRAYDPELDFDPGQVARLREAAAQHPLVFLPSHKSNLDTLVLNVALHDNGLPRTHVFGGINMSFGPMGAVFRRAGTVFIRRDTRGNPVYTFALREYIAYLIEKRFSLQFYMEGGRSRTGKLLPPRMGLLAYVADAYRQGRSDDVVLVPVSIAYDQLQEVGEYARESKGASKTAENVGWAIRTFREARGRYGKIYVRFGEPLSLRDALGPPDGGDEEAERLALQKVAFEVSRRINEVTPITATSLVTLSLLGAQGRALTVDLVRVTVKDPLEYALRRNLPLTSHMDLETDEGIQAALEELERHHVVIRYDAGPEPVFAIGPDQHLAAAFYRNSVIHFFLHGALAQLALARASVADGDDPVATFWESVLTMRDLLKFEFFFQPREEFSAAIAAELAFQDPAWEERVAKGPDEIRRLLGEIRPLNAHTVLRSFLEAYGVVAATLKNHEVPEGEELDERKFLSECLALGRQYELQQRITSPESLARPMFSNALKLAVSRGLVGAPIEDRQRFVEEVRSAIRDVELIESMSTTRILSLIDAEPGDSAS
ncbi:MAG: glycerol-3-phosphate 1-O-acyltransferase [Acidimicrobiales bacterium]